MTSGPEGANRRAVDFDRTRAALLSLALAILAILMVARPLADPSDDVYELSGPTMGTTYSVKIEADIDRAAGEELRTAVEQRLGHVNRLMSTYDSTSELSRFNRHRRLEPFGVSSELIEVLVRAREVSEGSDGAFDVTVAPLVDVWGFGPEPRGSESPDTAILAALRARIGNRGLVLDPHARTVAKTHPEIRVDLSAIAKGYAVDLVASELETRGFTSYLIEVGGELRAGGPKREGGAWRVGIERPEPQARRLHAVAHLTRQAIATSGDYRNFRDVGGRRRTHLIDPRTGSAIPFVGASVSVVDASAADADAWATALSVAGVDRGYELAVREGVAALFLVAARDTVRSRATPAFLTRLAAFREVGR